MENWCVVLSLAELAVCPTQKVLQDGTVAIILLTLGGWGREGGGTSLLRKLGWLTRISVSAVCFFLCTGAIVHSTVVLTCFKEVHYLRFPCACLSYCCNWSRTHLDLASIALFSFNCVGEVLIELKSWLY